MRHTERDAVSAFERAYPGIKPDYRELVSDFLGVEIFAIWYLDEDDDEWETVYACFSEKDGDHVFSDSKELFAFLSKLSQKRTSIHLREIVAAISFLALVATIIFLVVFRTMHGASTSDVLFIGFLSLVASGSVLFFRNWTLFRSAP